MAIIIGTPGDDDGVTNPALIGTEFSDSIDGLAGNDELFGLGGDDTLVGGVGDDTLAGGLGNDLLDGGSGLDWADYRAATGGIQLWLWTNGDGGDVEGADGTDRLMSVEYALGSDYGDSFRGDQFANHFVGNGGRDHLIGDGGDDTLEGGAGDDRMVGGAGADVMIGGSGSDEYWVDNAGDSLGLEAAYSMGGGIDIVEATIDFVLPLNYEILRVGLGASATGNDAPNRLVAYGPTGTVLNGRGGDDFVTGSDGADRLTGGAGQDSLTGRQGEDVFVFNTIADSYGDVYAGTSRRDTITDFSLGQDLVDLTAIDANPYYAGDQAWTFIGTAPFSAQAPWHGGELRYGMDGNGWIVLQGDWQGDGIAEFEIALTGLTSISAGDILL